MELKSLNFLRVVLEKDNTKPGEQIMVGKPVIYLYPDTIVNVSIKVNVLGSMNTSYPIYNNGWELIAFPDGTLKNKENARSYSYLFWEGEKTMTQSDKVYENGFIVSSDTLITFLEKSLSILGLNDKEQNDFITYWLPQLEANKLNFIHFRIGKEYESISSNLVNPKPLTEIRVFMEFKAIENSYKIKQQVLTKSTRKGFTLVEWGGSMIKEEISIAHLLEDSLIQIH